MWPELNTWIIPFWIKSWNKKLIISIFHELIDWLIRRLTFTLVSSLSWRSAIFWLEEGWNSLLINWTADDELWADLLLVTEDIELGTEIKLNVFFHIFCPIQTKFQWYQQAKLIPNSPPHTQETLYHIKLNALKWLWKLLIQQIFINITIDRWHFPHTHRLLTRARLSVVWKLLLDHQLCDDDQWKLHTEMVKIATLSTVKSLK